MRAARSRWGKADFCRGTFRAQIRQTTPGTLRRFGSIIFGSIICAPGYRKRSGLSRHKNCHAPRKRGIQYAAAYRFNHCCLWNTGSPASRAMTTEYASAFSRRRARPRLDRSSRPMRAQGRPGARCTRGLVCNVHKEVRTRAYRSSGEHPAFPAQWFDGLCRALLGDEFLLPPSSAN